LSASTSTSISAFASIVGMFRICTLKVTVFAAGSFETSIVPMSAAELFSPVESV
jgi:hypothetical protein